MKALMLLLIPLLVPNFVLAKPQAIEVVRVRVGSEVKTSKSGLAIRFVELIEDSRCPKGTNCVWAGEGRIKISVRAEGRKVQTFELATTEGKNKIAFDGYELRFVELAPRPAANIRIDRTKYTATFEVGKSNQS
ncbi:MAG TPA: hypothetical protein VLI65_03435 [Pyrinomonadaceae bacterium]|nr:hypothetical protein [Pyrinomonadaceae bacterium]